MPWRAKDVMQLRIEFVLRAAREEVPFSRVCEEFGISRRTGYRWMKRYREAGSVRGLAEHSRRPHGSPRKTPDGTEERVVALWQRHGWGARKLQVKLAERGCELSEITVHRILKRRGLIRRPKRIGQAIRRFQRERCNELAQMDFKGEYRVQGGWCYPLTLLDDCSRYLLGLWALPSMSTEAVQETLRSHFRQEGMPESLLLDHGIPWWSSSSGHGLTRLSVWFIKQDIGLIWAAIRHPQTLGKAERFHRTLDERTRHEGIPETLPGWEQWLPELRWEYNQVRPHEALEMKTPAQVYRRENLRPYQEDPPEWDYGGALTGIVNSAGCVTWRSERYFVCEALVGERVRIDELDGLLIVTFRNTTVREVNLRTGESLGVLTQPPKL